MQTMKAVRIHTFGGPEVLSLEDVPRPVPKETEVLAQVHAAGVIATDWQFRAGLMPEFLGLKLPVILGWDIAGIVTAVGANVTQFKVGDAVYAMLPGHGGYAEYAVLPDSLLAPKPRSLDYAHAAAVPLAAMTAYKSLYDAANLASGQTVLIHGASGGVGSFGVQLAKARGATVIATASTHNLEFVKTLGADEVIDYTATAFESVVHQVDVVFDPVGGDIQEPSFKTLRPGGILVSVAGGRPPSSELAAQYGVTGAFVGTEPDGAKLRAITDLIEAGKIKPFVETILPLNEVRKAHQLLESGRSRGKIVLQIIPG